MMDTFPGLQQDCLDVIKKCNALILAARTCRTDAIMGSQEGVHFQVQEMDRIASDVAGFCAALTYPSVVDEGERVSLPVESVPDGDGWRIESGNTFLNAWVRA
jgi:hypothetical protein